jgi:hypothetical protein
MGDFAPERDRAFARELHSVVRRHLPLPSSFESWRRTEVGATAPSHAPTWGGAFSCLGRPVLRSRTPYARPPWGTLLPIRTHGLLLWYPQKRRRCRKFRSKRPQIAIFMAPSAQDIRAVAEQKERSRALLASRYGRLAARLPKSLTSPPRTGELGRVGPAGPPDKLPGMPNYEGTRARTCSPRIRAISRSRRQSQPRVSTPARRSTRNGQPTTVTPSTPPGTERSAAPHHRRNRHRPCRTSGQKRSGRPTCASVSCRRRWSSNSTRTACTEGGRDNAPWGWRGCRRGGAAGAEDPYPPPSVPVGA